MFTPIDWILFSVVLAAAANVARAWAKDELYG